MVIARPQAAPNALLMLQDALKQYEAGQLPAARQLCQRVIQQQERNPDAWHLLGMVARGEGRLDIAVDCLGKAVAYNPGSIEIRNNYANALKESGQVEAACEQYRIAVNQQPDNPVIVSNLGSALNQLRQFEEAEVYFTRAVKLKPDYADAWYNLAVIHNTLGQKRERDAAIEHALAAEPHHALALHLRVQSQKSHDTALLKTMQTCFEQKTTSTDDKIQLAFGLGKAMDDRKEHDAAYRWFAAANRLKRLNYTFDIHGTESQFDWIKRIFTPEWIAHHRKDAYDGTSPLFIVGMPRSGTSLVEHILAQHSDVHGGGELFYMRDLLAAQERTTGRPYPLCLGNTLPEALPKLAEAYAAQLFALAPGGERYVTDKLPGNFCHAGLIAAIFAQAKIIYVERHPLDTGLSIFKTFFGDNLPYAYDQWEIGKMIALCRNLMAHWQKILSPNVFHTVSYETLVDQPEQEVRRMLEFLGLEWDEACLDFHNSDRPVTTASVVQVRQPLYRSAVRSSDAYAAFLKPMQAAVESLS